MFIGTLWPITNITGSLQPSANTNNDSVIDTTVPCLLHKYHTIIKTVTEYELSLSKKPKKQADLSKCVQMLLHIKGKIPPIKSPSVQDIVGYVLKYLLSNYKSCVSFMDLGR